MYSEIHYDETAGTDVGFWQRAVNYFHTLGINIERVITDHGAYYSSRYWWNYNAAAVISFKKTRH